MATCSFVVPSFAKTYPEFSYCSLPERRLDVLALQVDSPELGEIVPQLELLPKEFLSLSTKKVSFRLCFFCIGLGLNF